MAWIEVVGEGMVLKMCESACITNGTDILASIVSHISILE